MKKLYIKSIVFGLAAVALASCGNPGDELTSIQYSRNFSPTGVEAKVRNRTNVELSWNRAEGVTQYNIEVFANDSLTFSGSPVQSLTCTPDEMPITITGLEGETKYSFRVMALDGNTSRDSKWSGAYAKTESEQIFKTVKEDDIKGKQVTLRWPAGESADVITLSPGNITYNVTSADVAAGAATITGLTPETAYTATMTRNGKTRGKISFTTGVDLAETDILVKAGDDLKSAINDAPEGYRLVIEPGVYGIASSDAEVGGSVKITKKLSIKGLRQNDHPVIKGRFQIEAEVDIDQVSLDGAETDGGQAFDFSADGEYESFSITNSEVKNYTKGFYYLNKATLIKTMTIEGNIIEKVCWAENAGNPGGDFLDSRKGCFNTLSFKNNTVINCAEMRDFLRMDDNSSTVKASANIIVDHNTLYNVGSGGANYRVFYVRWKTGNKITFTNNIVVGTKYKRGFANNAATDANPTLDNNVYFNTTNLISLPADNTEKISWADEKGTVLDPQFKDAANGDFTITNDDVKDKKVGAPRWY